MALAFAMTIGSFAMLGPVDTYAKSKKVKTPKKVTFTKVSKFRGEVSLKWKYEKGCQYQIYRKDGDGPWKLIPWVNEFTDDESKLSRVNGYAGYYGSGDRNYSHVGILNLPTNSPKHRVYFDNWNLDGGRYSYKIRAYKSYKYKGKTKKKYGKFSKVVTLKVLPYEAQEAVKGKAFKLLQDTVAQCGGNPDNIWLDDEECALAQKWAKKWWANCRHLPYDDLDAWMAEVRADGIDGWEIPYTTSFGKDAKDYLNKYSTIAKDRYDTPFAEKTANGEQFKIGIGYYKGFVTLLYRKVDVSVE